MSGCNINGNHIIGINEVDGKMSLAINQIIGNHTIPKLDYLSDISMCIPAVEKVIAVWYVYGETVIGIDDKYYGYGTFK